MTFLLVALCLGLGRALGEYGQKCIDLGTGAQRQYTTDRNSVLYGDKYQKFEQQDLQGCADKCTADPKCLIWNHEVPLAMAAWCNIDPGLPGCNYDAKGDCYLSSKDFGWQYHYGYCHGTKYTPPPTPPPPPPSPPAPPPVPGAQHHWAVIMAGSNTYANYRHQADACHAYQIAKKNGIPEENIILLAYDDVANDSANPFPGKMFNKPDGPDVYEGCKISYKGAEVNKANFLKVLTGDSSASGPVLKSTSNDRVFVYYADHGGVGILGVPDGAAGGYIHAKEVNDALVTMHSKGMYAELLFYVEACESGSIFGDSLLQATNVLAVTAASADEPSYGFYCSPQDTVNGKHIGSCLGDEFSIRWLEDADLGKTNSETVKQQIDTVTQAVRNSHVQHFGDLAGIGAEVIGDFEGSSAIAMDINVDFASPFSGNSSQSAVSSRDVEVHLAYYRMEQAETLEQKRATQKQLTSLLARRQAADEKFMQIALMAAGGNKSKAQAMIDDDVASPINVNCHFDALQLVSQNCGAFDDYTMRYSRLFANLCDTTISSLAQIKDAVQKICDDKANLMV